MAGAGRGSGWEAGTCVITITAAWRRYRAQDRSVDYRRRHMLDRRGRTQEAGGRAYICVAAKDGDGNSRK
ncbi:hypothetical protein OG21DRAFT_1507052 [Imleria badia]|nr:hypothetical protein OG21DRAFT_1507052 [Imleria badia]